MTHLNPWLMHENMEFQKYYITVCSNNIRKDFELCYAFYTILSRLLAIPVE